VLGASVTRIVGVVGDSVVGCTEESARGSVGLRDGERVCEVGVVEGSSVGLAVGEADGDGVVVQHTM